MNKSSDKKITPTQAAAIIGVSGPRVSQLIADGELKAERKRMGKQVRIYLSEVDVLAYKEKREDFLAVA